MATGPYHKWLGIPPDQQPASHYRLLAIEQFESDADVIDGAAERQTVYLRTLQTGPDAELAEQLLSEVAAARVCSRFAQALPMSNSRSSASRRSARRAIAPERCRLARLVHRAIGPGSWQ
jgi:hypothetical protein